MINNYIDIIVCLLENIFDNEVDYVKEVGVKVVEFIENDGVIYLFGCGYLYILIEEVFYCVGGLVVIYLILYELFMFYEGVVVLFVLEWKNDYVKIFMVEEDICFGDIMIVLLMFGWNFVLIDVVEIVCEKGVFVIVIILF